MKIGIGYDTHVFAENRKLILGGVEIPYEKGLLGHSDADVLIHAIMDAILGALGEGDIGRHFPDTDAKFKNISSLILLDNVADLLNKKAYKVINIDSVIIAQKPKMKDYIDDMRHNLANVLKCNYEDINIKATTTEKMGPEGEGKCITCQAVCLIEKLNA